MHIVSIGYSDFSSFFAENPCFPRTFSAFEYFQCFDVNCSEKFCVKKHIRIFKEGANNFWKEQYFCILIEFCFCFRRTPLWT